MDWNRIQESKRVSISQILSLSDRTRSQAGLGVFDQATLCRFPSLGPEVQGDSDARHSVDPTQLSCQRRRLDNRTPSDQQQPLLPTLETNPPPPTNHG